MRNTKSHFACSYIAPNPDKVFREQMLDHMISMDQKVQQYNDPNAPLVSRRQSLQVANRDPAWLRKVKAKRLKEANMS